MTTCTFRRSWNSRQVCRRRVPAGAPHSGPRQGHRSGERRSPHHRERGKGSHRRRVRVTGPGRFLLNHHLRNGARAKTVLTDVGPVELSVPRDRDSSFRAALLDDPAQLAESGAVPGATGGNDRRDTEFADQGSVLVVVVAAVGVDLRCPAAGRPRLPRIGGIACTSGMSWVTSLRLPPVSSTGNGTPPASVMRWCLERGRLRSTGLRPVWAALERPHMTRIDHRP